MTPRQARIGVDLFTACVVASVGVALAGFTWRLLGDPGTRTGATSVAAHPVRPVDIAPIIAAAPFGTGGSNAAGAPLTDQPFVLRGILLASPRSASTALIQIGEAPAVAFGIGQAVGGATIEAIELDHVVLASGGRRQMLAFPQKPGSTAPGAPPSPPSAPVATPPSAAGGASGFIQNLGATQVGDSVRVGDGVSPMGRLAGLQPGDTIERINGQSVADLTRDPGAYARLSGTGVARIELVRGGQRLTLIVPLR